MSKQDLSALSRLDKLKLLDALDEKSRRQKEARSPYQPNEGQRPVHKSKALERYCFAANGSGKTTMLVNEVHWAASGYNPVTGESSYVPAKIIVVLDNPAKVDDVFLREYRKWHPLKAEQLHKRGKPYYTQITYDNGSTVDFFFHLQEEMAAESVEWTDLFFDEPCNRRLYVALKRGGRSKQKLGRILFIGTPLAASWLRTDVYEPWVKGERPNVECFRFSTHVNKDNLAVGYIEEFERVLSDREKAVRLHGNFFDTDGLALVHLFKRDVHLIDPPTWPQHWPTMVVIDPAMAKAHVAILVGITPEDRLVYLKELSYKGAPREFGRQLKDFYAGYRVVDIVCDSLGSSELSGGDGVLSFIQVLRDQGIRVRATTYDEKQDEAFIQMIQEALAIPSEPDNFGKREPRLKINRQCRGIIYDIENVAWQRYRNEEEYKPKLEISKRDYLASLKYALAAQPRFSKGRERPIRGNARAGLTNQEKWRRRQL